MRQNTTRHMKGAGGMSRIGGIAKGVTDAIDEYPPDQGGSCGSSLPGLPTFSSPDYSPLSKKGKRKEKKYLKRKRDPSCLEGFYQVKVLGPHKHASSPIILDPAPDAHEETSYARCGDVRNALAIPVLPNRPLCVILLAGC